MSIASQGPPSDYAVLAKAREVLAYDRDPARLGRPVSLLLGGGSLALVALALIVALAYRTWYLERIDADRGWFGVSLLFVIYVFGIFVFSYAYALYDMGKAMRLTAVVAFVSVVAIFAVIGALALLSKVKDGTGLLQGKSGAVRAVGIFTPTDEDSYEVEPLPDDLPPPQPFTIGCASCGARFAPVPPEAICPYCGQAALAG
jgi:hypothetical protein